VSNSPLVTDLRQKLVDCKKEAHRHTRRAQAENRGMTAAESSAFDQAISSSHEIEERIIELEAQDVRESAASAHRVEIGATGTPSTSSAYTNSRESYARDNYAHSFFADQRSAQLGDVAAAQRLAANNEVRRLETRAGDLSSTTATAGGVFAPPGWLIDEYVALARPGRVCADLMHKVPLPGGVSSIALPKIGGGTTALVQASQNSALSDTAMTTTSVSSGISLIGGRQTISLQLIQQSPGASFDQIVLQDLAADAARNLDLQVISGSGSAGQLRGIAQVVGGSTVTFTTASPKVVDGTTSANSFYNAVIKAVTTVAQNRYAPATAIVMRPDRWGWILEALDTSSRPLVTPDGPQYNGLAVSTEPTAQGAAGTLVGLPVYLDPNIPVTWNSTTNQDAVLVLRTDDMWLYESELELRTFDSTYADQASILARSIQYAAFIPDRQPASVGVVQGTGMVQAVL
jgi:HK97 family phage major capsid protein